MASINVSSRGKCHGPVETKALLRHCSRDKRLEDNHSNDNIVRSLTSQNLQWPDTSYEDICKRYDERISECHTRWTKQTVTCVDIEIPAPKELDDSDFPKWSNEVRNILADKYGGKNLIGVFGHVDEKGKDYKDENGDMVTPRSHLHCFVVPDIGDDHLCCKKFVTIPAINDLNNAIQEMTETEFGTYFMDGSKKKGHDSVETLKNKSLRKENEDLKAENKRLDMDNRSVRLSLMANEKALTKVQTDLEKARNDLEDLMELEAEYKSLKAENETLISQNETLKTEQKALQNEVDNLKNESETLRSSVGTMRTNVQSFETAVTSVETDWSSIRRRDDRQME